MNGASAFVCPLILASLDCLSPPAVNSGGGGSEDSFTGCFRSHSATLSAPVFGLLAYLNIHVLVGRDLIPVVLPLTAVKELTYKSDY